MHIRFGSDDSSRENKEQEGVRGGTKSGKTSNNTNHVETWEKGHFMLRKCATQMEDISYICLCN